MADYHVAIANAAKRELKKLPKSAQGQVAKTLSKLAEAPHPRGSEKLQGRPAFYRIRSGDYRVIYSVRVEIRLVIVLVIRDRKDAFKGLDELDGKLAAALGAMAETILERSSVEGIA